MHCIIKTTTPYPPSHTHLPLHLHYPPPHPPHTQQEKALQVAKEMTTAFSIALQQKTLLLMPSTAAPPPPTHPTPKQAVGVERWRIRSQQLQCITTLTGMPSVVIPLAGPFGMCSVTLMGLTNADSRVVASAMQLVPRLEAALTNFGQLMREKAAAGGGEGGTQGVDGAGKARDGMGSTPAGGNHAARRGSSNNTQVPAHLSATAAAGGARDAAPPTASPPPSAAPPPKAPTPKEAAAVAARARAEELKAAGNAAFKAGAYDAAVAQYSAAIEAAPGADVVQAVYYSNRAMAYLKLMEFDLVWRGGDDDGGGFLLYIFTVSCVVFMQQSMQSAHTHVNHTHPHKNKQGQGRL